MPSRRAKSVERIRPISTFVRWSPTLDVRSIDVDDGCPPIFHAADLSQSRFQSVRHHLSADGAVWLCEQAVAAASDRVLLVFSAPDSGPPLCLSGTVEGGGRLSIPRLPLSWRLAALNFARRLPPQPPNSPSEPPPQLELPGDESLRLRPQVPAPATTIAPTEELASVVVALRAHHQTFDDLATGGDIDRRRLRAFISALYALDVVTEAPQPLTDAADPFAFLGLHWSAPPSMIRCTYGRLRRRLAGASDNHATRQLLERAFDLLRHRDDRRRLRHSLIPPPVFGEVLNRFHDDLGRARSADDTSTAIDLCRRIIELDPSDETTKHTLDELIATS